MWMCMVYYLPLDEAFACIECQHHNNILTNNSDCVWFLVQCKARFDTKKMLQRQWGLRLALFISILWVSVELQMQTIYNIEKYRVEGNFSIFILFFFCLWMNNKWVYFGPRKIAKWMMIGQIWRRQSTLSGQRLCHDHDADCWAFCHQTTKINMFD